MPPHCCHLPIDPPYPGAAGWVPDGAAVPGAVPVGAAMPVPEGAAERETVMVCTQEVLPLDFGGDGLLLSTGEAGADEGPECTELLRWLG